ncbi:hypothetical protein Tco_0880523, partial [Tanacetum coccineum]
MLRIEILHDVVGTSGYHCGVLRSFPVERIEQGIGRYHLKSLGGNIAEACGSASGQAEHAVGQDGLGGSDVGVVIGLSVNDGQGGAGGASVGVGSQ